MNLKSVATKVKRAFQGTVNNNFYDVSTKEHREHQAKEDYEKAISEKIPHTKNMVLMDNYYNGRSYTEQQAAAMKETLGINFDPPGLPLGFVEVESQIDERIYAFQFKGREGQDAKKALEREKAVNYVLYNNGIEEQNIDNERCLNKLGNAFWKVSWDKSIKGMGYTGDIVLGNPDPANIFPDPNAYDIDDCEYIIYAFRMHRRKLKRMFGDIIDDITDDGERMNTEIYENTPTKNQAFDETMLVMEYWYRDDEGDIACSIQVNYVEVKWIEKYWEVTRHSGNQMYPIIKYGKIPVQKSFWDKGEIETVKDLIDAANREFITAILNDAFMANDILVYEDQSLAEGQPTPGNIPGEHVRMKQGQIGAIRRLSGVAENSNLLNMITFIKEQIQETNGNYDSGQGKEPVRVTTASGIAQLNEKADARKVTKKAGRVEGFKRLAILADWTVLEFYNMDRMLMIGAKEEGADDEQVNFNRDNHAVMQGVEGKQVPYFPRVDVEITAGDGIRKSKAFTLQATQELAATPVTPENVGIMISYVQLLDLPNKDEIIRTMAAAVGQQIQQRQMAMQPPPPPVEKPQPEIDPHKNALELTKLQYEAKLQDDKQAFDKEMAAMQDQWDKEKIILKGQIDAKINEQKAKHTQTLTRMKPKQMVGSGKK